MEEMMGRVEEFLETASEAISHHATELAVSLQSGGDAAKPEPDGPAGGGEVLDAVAEAAVDIGVFVLDVLTSD